MNNFPFYNHYAIKLVVNNATKIDETLIDGFGQALVDGLGVHVVKTEKHVFSNGGLTKVFILSESHLIIHTWPELNAIHLNLMTCKETISKEMIEKIVSGFGATEVQVAEIE